MSFSFLRVNWWIKAQKHFIGRLRPTMATYVSTELLLPIFYENHECRPLSLNCLSQTHWECIQFFPALWGWDSNSAQSMRYPMKINNAICYKSWSSIKLPMDCQTIKFFWHSIGSECNMNITQKSAIRAPAWIILSNKTFQDIEVV